MTLRRMTRLEALRRMLKVETTPRPLREPTRYQLPAPMTLAQWRLKYDRT